MGDWEIREFKEDLASYKAVRQEAVRENEDAFLVSYEEELMATDEALRKRLLIDATRGCVIGAFLDGEIVGMGGLMRPERTKASHRAFIWGMYVRETLRGRGMGRALLTHLINHARTIDGVDIVELSVVEGNAAARGLYTKMGFVFRGVTEDAMRVGDRSLDEEHFELRLSTLA